MSLTADMPNMIIWGAQLRLCVHTFLIVEKMVQDIWNRRQWLQKDKILTTEVSLWWKGTSALVAVAVLQ